MRLEIENDARPVDGPVIQLRHVEEPPVLMTREWGLYPLGPYVGMPVILKHPHNHPQRRPHAQPKS